MIRPCHPSQSPPGTGPRFITSPPTVALTWPVVVGGDGEEETGTGLGVEIIDEDGR